jgi:8-oxo-dGTP diphosphatase
VKAAEQGVRVAGQQRYQVIPRTLVFLTSVNPQTGNQEVLLLKGAPNKRLWANQYNGLGGHVEAHEDVYAAAEREFLEETGLALTSLTLRGVVNIDTGHNEQGTRAGVIIFVFRAESPERAVRAAPEGAAEWIPIDDLLGYPLVDDLYQLIPRALSDGPIFFGHYYPQPDGALRYQFHDE